MTIYHITHCKNVQKIIERGQLLAHKAMVENGLSYVNIAHYTIRYKREQTRVPVRPYGFLNEYVPFYFAPRSPMLYAIHKGNVEGYEEGQSSVVYLISSTKIVGNSDLEFVFTDGHPVMSLTKFFNSTNYLNELDWSVMSSKMWTDTLDQPDRKRRRQAEFLVKGHFPWRLLTNMVVCNTATARQVAKLLSGQEHQPNVRIDKSLYF